MLKAVLPLALVFAAGTALACPEAGKAMDAKVDLSPSVTAALAVKPQQSKAAPEAARKAVKPAEAKKPAT